MAGIDPSLGINRWGTAYGSLGGSGMAGSLHPGGCLFAMGDGTVRWVSQDVAAGVLGELSTIADGEAASLE